MSTQAKHGIILMIAGVVSFLGSLYAFFRWEIVAQITASVAMFSLSSVMVWVGWILFYVKVKKYAR